PLQEGARGLGVASASASAGDSREAARPRAGPPLLGPAVASEMEPGTGALGAHLPSHGADARADRGQARREPVPRHADPARGLRPRQALTLPEREARTGRTLER